MVTCCIWCQSKLIKKNGHHRTRRQNYLCNDHQRAGKQNYLCKSCGKQFAVGAYHISAKQKESAKILFIEKMPMSRIGQALKVSPRWLAWFLKKEIAQAVHLLKAKKIIEEEAVEILVLRMNELWPLVKGREETPWLWFALNKATRQVIACYIGEQKPTSLNKLLNKVPLPWREKLKSIPVVL